MPIKLPLPIRRLSQREFGDIAFEVMRHVFAIHNELGRFFDEKIYKRELVHRLPGVHLEVPIDISFDCFQKRCFLDMLVAEGGVFEFKAVESITGRNRAQLLHYLLLCDLNHGKLIDVRPEDVEHEFVNTHWTHAARTQFNVQTGTWNASLPGMVRLRDFMTALLRDLGTGLAVALYEEAFMQCFGVETDVGVVNEGHELGHQRFRVVGPGVALKITAFDEKLEMFEMHARRLLAHTDLRAIAWVNVNMKEVRFSTLEL